MKIDIKEILTLPNNIMIALSIAGGAVLFLPNVVADKMYITDLKDKYGFVIGIVFITIVSILIVNLGYKIIKTISKAKSKKAFYEGVIKKLGSLNNYQQAVIYLLYQEDNRTFSLPVYDGAIAELEHNIMINKMPGDHPISYRDINNPRVPYMLQPWVVNELNGNKELCDSFKKSLEEHL